MPALVRCSAGVITELLAAPGFPVQMSGAPLLPRNFSFSFSKCAFRRDIVMDARRHFRRALIWIR